MKDNGCGVEMSRQDCLRVVTVFGKRSVVFDLALVISLSRYNAFVVQCLILSGFVTHQKPITKT